MWKVWLLCWEFQALLSLYFTQNFGSLEGRVAIPASLALWSLFLLAIANLVLKGETGIWPICCICRPKVSGLEGTVDIQTTPASLVQDVCRAHPASGRLFAQPLLLLPPAERAARECWVPDRCFAAVGATGRNSHTCFLLATTSSPDGSPNAKGPAEKVLIKLRVGGLGLHGSRGRSCVSLCLLARQGTQRGLFSG